MNLFSCTLVTFVRLLHAFLVWFHSTHYTAHSSTLTSSNLLSIVGSNVTLTCPGNTTNNTYAWTRDGITIFDNLKLNTDMFASQKYQLTTNVSARHIQISNVTKTDDGQYCCDSIAVKKYCSHLRVVDTIDIVVVHLSNNSLFCNSTHIPDTYKLSLWEHQAFTGEHLRELDGTENGILNVNADFPTFYNDGRYMCKAKNIPTNMKLQSEYKDIYFRGKPVCINITHEVKWSVVKFQATIYSSNISKFEWYNNSDRLTEGTKYKSEVAERTITVEVYNKSIQLKTYMLSLIVRHITIDDFDSQYTVKVSNSNESINCSENLQLGNIPNPPQHIKVTPRINGFSVKWTLDSEKGQIVVVRYRSTDRNSKWQTFRTGSSNESNASFSNLPSDTEIEIYIYAKNLFGKSNNTVIFLRTLKEQNTGTNGQRVIIIYVLSSFVAVIGILMTTKILTRIKRRIKDTNKDHRNLVVDQNKRGKTRVREISQERKGIFEEVVLNPQRDGSRFIITTSMSMLEDN